MQISNITADYIHYTLTNDASEEFEHHYPTGCVASRLG